MPCRVPSAIPSLDTARNSSCACDKSRLGWHDGLTAPRERQPGSKNSTLTRLDNLGKEVGQQRHRTENCE
eukprot:2852960-Rhodomonas_salina.1